MDDSYHKCTKPTVFRNEFMIALAYIVNLVYYFYIGGNYEEKNCNCNAKFFIRITCAC